jgi:hypothetical protein
MKTITLTILLIAVTLLSAPAALAADPEVDVARRAAKQHNETLVNAQERREKAVQAAEKAYLTQSIDAKRRLVADLTRAMQIAARKDNTDNVVIISRQIERLKESIEQLELERDQIGREDDPNLMKGLDPRLVGFLAVRHDDPNTDDIVRVYEVRPDGRVKVVADVNNDQPGIDVGAVYQGFISDGQRNGRAQQFEITDNGNVVVRHGHPDQINNAGVMTWQYPLSQTMYRSMDDVKKAAAQADARDVVQDQPDNDVDPDVFEEDPVADDETDGNDFFGIPIED